MQFKIILHTTAYSSLPFNYWYPLSAAIYKIIEAADKSFGTFLHNTGYGDGNKSFKLFTFSDIKTPLKKRGDLMQLLGTEAEVIICFYMLLAAKIFIKALFKYQQLQIADRQSKTAFRIAEVKSLPEVSANAGSITLQPLSPLVVGRKNEHGHYNHRSPEDSDFADWLYFN
ncbi:MAG TPA: hypothetical protein VEY06_08455 [Flavisolibacter sp.]|nr:hypothetical protein [Flavisolibacter sp.]